MSTIYKYVCNAFSLQMVPQTEGAEYTIKTKVIPQPSNEVIQATPSAVGHADIARVIGVPMNRISVTLERGDKVLVLQVVGGRLPEGCTELPDGVSLIWIEVSIE